MSIIKNNQQSGIAVLEASITLPVFVTLVFFAFELLKVNMVKNAVEKIAFEAGLRFAATGTIENFETTIKRHMPPGTDWKKVSYYFAMYESLDTMCASAPYGNEEVYWPESETFSTNTHDIVDTNRNSKFDSRNTSASIALTNQYDPTSTLNTISSLNNKVFVLTVVCDYKFSSAMVEKLFAGGSNTKSYNEGNNNTPYAGRGKKFLIYGKMVGMTDLSAEESSNGGS